MVAVRFHAVNGGVDVVSAFICSRGFVFRRGRRHIQRRNGRRRYNYECYGTGGNETNVISVIVGIHLWPGKLTGFYYSA